MDRKRLHIVSFDNPCPPDYGGVIDVFYKIQALHSEGYEIYLHCIVDTDSKAAPELLALVKQIHFYRRNKRQSVLKLFSSIPFAALSRYTPKLGKNLLSIEAPILFEGLQTTYVIRKHDFVSRKMLLRLHNIESNYFAGSAASETNWIKKLLYLSESKKYITYQKILAKFDKVLTLSVAETKFVDESYGNAAYVPVFHGNAAPDDVSGFGKFALYHGDLRLPDNKRAVRFLIKVFAKIPDYPLVIAAGSAGQFIVEEIAAFPNMRFVEIESQLQLGQLLNDAHINVMLSFQESGTKLKLVNALYKSRFCVINRNMVDDPILQDLCTIAESESEFIEAVNRLKTEPYVDFEIREILLSHVLNDTENAKKIAGILGD